MVSAELLFSLATLIASISLAVLCAFACWRWASPATRQAKRPPSELPTGISGRLATLEADQVEFASALEKISKTLKRWNSRQAVQDHRARQSDAFSDSPPPLGASKAELREFYSKKIGRDVRFPPARSDLVNTPDTTEPNERTN